jgi:hypothetical protein
LRAEISPFGNMDIDHNFENTIESDNNGEIADGASSCHPTDSQEASPELLESTPEADGGNQIATPEVKKESVLSVNPGASPEPKHVEETDASVVPSSNLPGFEPRPEVTHVNFLTQYPLEMPPSTPQPSSPLRIAIDSIHWTRHAEDNHTTSPTERKEEAVQPPTEVCGFVRISKAEEHGTHTEGIFP